MWNILIVIIIAVLIWMMNPLSHSSIKPTPKVEKKTINEVNQVLDNTQQQVDYARKMQQEEQNNLNN